MKGEAKKKVSTVSTKQRKDDKKVTREIKFFTVFNFFQIL